MQSESPAGATGSKWTDDPVYGLRRMTLSDEAEGNPTLSDDQLYILRSIALAAASMSMVSGLLVGFWFIRMKRSFRHHLIMLMIFSDFYKASWQLIYPAVVFTKGAVSSESRFCQTAGFMMSMGIEASDFAVLAIAVHSALYIFRPGLGRVGEGGLFRYRYYVYTAWFAFSVMMPSLAFVNKAPAYSAQGTFCYLPVRPFWFRLALAWIPRYLILLTILILYAAIYVYVRMKFMTFRTSVGASTLDVETVDLAPPEQPKEPPRLPSLDSHGLIPPPTDSQPTPPNGIEQPFAKALLAPFHDRTNLSSSSDSRSCDSRRGSFPTLFPHGMMIPPSSVEDRTSTDKRRQINDTANEEARRRRIAISRQLRLLFIYPLVYALMWVPPLISHALQFTDRFVQHPSFPLHCVVAFTLPFQCFVDCWLFTIREKPWRYIPETHYGFGLRKCKGKSAKIGAEEGGDLAWRNRKHMSFEARKAYERRDAETHEAAEEWYKRGGDRRERERERERERPERRPRESWWDLEQRRAEEVDLEDEEEEEEEDEDEIMGVGPQIRYDEFDELSSIEKNGGGGGGGNPSSSGGG
ncbi:G protein-coupled glucose receptor regulating Gpa2-domain-containing protein [Tricharina praecox]|uniref:G protein-coupled glucose receptor regulating Gpa2-domain-containing protein n=1 Tax=Tricharina praecox TaxID=43433 RepID=UPI00221E3F4F|nr:G protein-coupled glucose receptor regulating Gpa2-domain-containing protein [Tricharina praecox]KAI5849221.1 G protein-coupled glucose receptor regulating Gpa2-domain-containing protein [Tricharina praecox]